MADPDALVAHIDAIRDEDPYTQLMEERGVSGFLYYAQLLTVEDTTPTTTSTTTPTTPTTASPAAPPEAPPATPVPGTPTFTG